MKPILMAETNMHRLPLRKTAVALIKELGSESNAHGVARIIRSRDSRRKVVWSLLVLFGIGSAISQLSSLVHKYLQYQVVEISEIQDGLPVEFPSVTVCNIEPISWRKLRQLLNGTTTNSSDVRAWLQFLETFDFGTQQAHLRSIRAFHENMGEDVAYVRHSLNESLLHCRFNKQPCSTANFTTSFDGNYYSCFTFNAQSASEQEQRLIVDSTGPEHGLSVVMFLDNNFPPLGGYGVYTLDTNILHSAGARVMVHAPNTLPIPVDHGQDVAPGFSTSVAIKPFLHARLAQPYGNCSDTQLRGLPSFTSTYSTCIAVCKQELMVRECHCRSSALPHIPSLLHVPYCGHVPRWRHMIRHVQAYNRSQRMPKLQCEKRAMDRLKNDRGYEAECGCTHPCGELSYHMSTSMSYWPTELYQFHALRELYGDDILQSPLSRAYKLHESNIMAGEVLLRQLSQQHRQTSNNGTAASLSEGDEEDETSPQSKGESGSSSASSFANRHDGSSRGSKTRESPSRSSETRSTPTQRSGTRSTLARRSRTRSTPARRSTSWGTSARSSETRSTLARSSETHDTPSPSSATRGADADNQEHFYDGQQNRTLKNSTLSAQNSREKPQTNNGDVGDKEQQRPMLEYSSQQLDNLREASTDIRQNLLRLNVYLEDLSIVKYKQMPAYGMEDLFADIGGTLGLWMGVSVLTIMELLELIIRVTHLFLKAEWKPSELCPNEDQHATTNVRDRVTDLRGREDWEMKTCRGECRHVHRDYRDQIFRDSERRNTTREGRDRSLFVDLYTEYHQKDDDIDNDVESGGGERARDRGYSYRSEADYRCSDGSNVPQGLSDMNGHIVKESGSMDSPKTRPGRTSYWGLKRAKRKT